jgi:hypothetical protein
MHTDINIIYTCGLCQVLLEVLHVCYKELLLASEVLVYFAVLIEDMNYYYLLLQLHMCATVDCASWFLKAIMNPS